MKFKPKQLDSKIVKTFTETEVGSLLENIDEKFDFLVEGQKTLDNRIGRVGTKVDVLGTKVDVLETKVEVLTDTVGEMKVQLTDINDKLDRKEDKSVVRQLNARITALEAK